MRWQRESDDLERARELEWLEADGLGGFASGTASGLRTRRYHGLLCCAKTPPTGRVMLVAGLEVTLDLGQGPRALSSHCYGPDVTHPDGLSRLTAFEAEPFPTWTQRVDDVEIQHSLVALRDRPAVVLRWRLGRRLPGARLSVRPLLAVRDVHGLQHERDDLSTDAVVDGRRVSWQPAPGEPRIVARAEATYAHDPLWYRNFLYSQERARGYGSSEDLLSPGTLEFDLTEGEAFLVLQAEAAGLPPLEFEERAIARTAARLFAAERARREAFPTPLDRRAQDYIVRRGAGCSLIAGYPWFADWGRDTFLALRGLCLARGRLDESGSILSAWAGLVSSGMLPNRFVDLGEAPEFNSVDAALWFVVAVGDHLGACAAAGRPVAAHPRRRLEAAVRAVLEGYTHGTRYGVRADADGLLACGQAGWQLTWMDAKVGEEVVTPRIGKPVEVQALWAAALSVGARLDPRWKEALGRVQRAFPERFWNEERGHLNDVVDVDHVPGTYDPTLRPNQVLAVGGLRTMLLDLGRARRVVDELEAELLTPLGLRTLPRDHPEYRGTYGGDPAARDRAYHQGTVWPWLLGPFVEAWVRVRGSTASAKDEARERFLPPLHAHLSTAGLGHVSEIADGDAPHTPRGAPFQAWSLGELLRLERVVLARPQAYRPRVPRADLSRT